MKRYLLLLLLGSGASIAALSGTVMAQSVPLRGGYETSEAGTTAEIAPSSRYKTPLALRKTTTSSNFGGRSQTDSAAMMTGSRATSLSEGGSRFKMPVPEAKVEPEMENLTGSLAQKVTPLPSTRTQAEDLKTPDPYRLANTRRRMQEDDPFAPVGMRYGNMTFFPTLETSIGFDSNYQRYRGGDSAGFAEVLPALKVQSDWARHSFDTDLQLGFRRYFSNDDDANRPNLKGTINGRADVMRDLRIVGGANGSIVENSNNADTPAAAAERPLSYLYSGNLGVEKQFNRATFTLRGLLDRAEYDNVKLINGTTFSNADRSYTGYGLRLRAAYEVSPAIAPFVEGQWDVREYDQSIDRNGFRRDSKGYGLRVGTTYELTRLVQLESSLGYAQRNYEDPLLPKLRGPSVDFAVVWTPSPLTNVRLRGSTVLDETTLNGASGSIGRSVGIEVKHALRRHILLTTSLDYTNSDYQGFARTDQTIRGVLRADYKLNRAIALFGAYRFEHLLSNIAGQDYSSHVFMSGVKLAR